MEYVAKSTKANSFFFLPIYILTLFIFIVDWIAAVPVWRAINHPGATYSLAPYPGLAEPARWSRRTGAE